MSAPLHHVRIVGAGLIGTSIGLALRKRDIAVTMVDSSDAAQALAQDLLNIPASQRPADLVIFALPISAISSVIENEYLQNLNATFIDISSVKVKVINEVKSSSLPASRFLPTHPMAGREVGGAQSARGDLFQDRPWIYDPDGVDGDVLRNGLALIELCGGHPVALASQAHDEAVAAISHLPQLLASLLARSLHGLQPSALDLAGAGLRDTTRIAGSDPKLWREILSANNQALLPLLKAVSVDLSDLIAHLDDPDFIEKFIEGGNSGRNLIPGKHGGVARKYTYLPVVIEDKPGQLAALFDLCAEAGVNVEDLSIEHSPEQFTGLITLALSSSDADTLYNHLLKSGWRVHEARS